MKKILQNLTLIASILIVFIVTSVATVIAVIIVATDNFLVLLKIKKPIAYYYNPLGTQRGHYLDPKEAWHRKVRCLISGWNLLP